MANKSDVLIIGGGTAGIMVAARMLKEDPNLSVSIIEPADAHYYQPAWTLVGAGTYNYEKTKRSMASVMPKKANWIKEYADRFLPEENKVITSGGKEYTYDYLVVCPGIKIDPSLVEGLPEAMDKGVVCSNYTDPMHTWDVLKNFKGGTALFTQPTTPIKCGGAPQKIMYLAGDLWQKNGVARNTDIVFATAGTIIFGVPEIAKTLMQVVDRNDINLRFGYKLVAVDAREQIAWYEMAPHEKEYNHKDIEVIIDGNRKGIKFDMMHLAPPQSAPDFIKTSPLANEAGWVDVDHGTLQHNKYSNIFSLGDVAGLPTAKTGAAIRKQVPIVTENIKRLMVNKPKYEKTYNGYSSCPLVTGYGKMALAEFDYDNNFTPDPKLKQMLVFDSSKEHWRLWILKKYILPYLYWNKMMKGVDV